MKKSLIIIIIVASVSLLFAGCEEKQKIFALSKETLMDKIKGGWAAQTIGVTFGGPTEFKYNGCFIPDSVVIPWPPNYHLWWFENQGSIYDDIYMDLTFVDMFDKHGIDASAEVIGNAFANAEYKLWHANQAARYNILNGVVPPESGYWKNNPHADDIDFQIEADFAGLMSPGMPNSASEICDKVGHIMCYGDGWYGGVYVAAMYSLAFISNEIPFIVKEALKAIPEKSSYYQCINDVIGWCEQYPDWKVTWQLVEDKWADEINCPKGTKDPYNIDAKVNSAYVVMGLLYGGGDMEKTLEISTRCGADSDCNPATAAGILGTMIGYNNIDAKWLDDLKEVEDMNFEHTEISLNKTYELGFKQALEMIIRGGGELTDTEVKIVVQNPKPVKFEQSFEGLELVKKDRFPNVSIRREPFSYEFTGTGIVCSGRVRPGGECPIDYVAEVEIDINGKKEIVKMPSDFVTRRLDIYWNYDLPKNDYQVIVTWLNPIPEANLTIDDVVAYTTK